VIPGIRWILFSPESRRNTAAPSPSREFILHYLEERGMPITLANCAPSGEMDDDWEVEALSRRLRAMERDGQLIRNRREGYGSVAKMNLVTGRVIGHPEGHGFLIPMKAATICSSRPARCVNCCTATGRWRG
jgi:ribonuclease R